MKLTDYAASALSELPALEGCDTPWEAVDHIEELISKTIEHLDPADYKIKDSVAVHKSARVDAKAMIVGPAIIGKNSLVGPFSFLRGGVFLGENSLIGFCCEIKTSLILANSAVTHLNYVADSIIGSGVNLEAGVVFLNYFNERNVKEIIVEVDGQKIATGTQKFGALVGDNCKLGGNAALGPGTILKPGTIVKRLELVEQT